jgi:hypothetical protein
MRIQHRNNQTLTFILIGSILESTHLCLDVHIPLVHQLERNPDPFPLNYQAPLQPINTYDNKPTTLLPASGPDLSSPICA